MRTGGRGSLAKIRGLTRIQIFEIRASLVTVCWVYATMTMRRVEGRRGCRPCFRLMNVLLALQQCSFTALQNGQHPRRTTIDNPNVYDCRLVITNVRLSHRCEIIGHVWWILGVLIMLLRS